MKRIAVLAAILGLAWLAKFLHSESVYARYAATSRDPRGKGCPL